MSQKTLSPEAIPAIPAIPPSLPALAPPLAHLEIRKRDRFGEGHFGAPRDGGRRRHMGLDLVALPGTPVTSPLDGTVTRLGWPYGNDPSYRYVEVTADTGLVVRHFYVAPEIGFGRRVTAGESCLGTVQDLTRRYPDITNHLHLEMRQAADPACRDHCPRDARGRRRNLYRGYSVIDPTPLLFIPA